MEGQVRERREKKSIKREREKKTQAMNKGEKYKKEKILEEK